ncbi:hypothetical protein GBC23_03565 [Bifidobacterium longum]|nr:hypothetical protein DVB78_06605 [Bifidobacterium longum subsp. longum]KAB7221797.1 hypothetical protein GBC54_01885 [Bifidobacterium longum]KAB7223592.1 hypothetical protein GBC31_01905 [Bifidobacterium longum]KAB7226854.1 hypothetical protein GBC23_03565 [Bifidobacterium longum]KAB7227996.1 hypothetical protein GBC52_01880 [Bifidobacterium longum]
MRSNAPIDISVTSTSGRLVGLRHRLMATAPKSQVYITAKSLDIRSISAPNTFSAYGSLSTMPMRMLRLRASSITFTPSVCPTPNYSVLTRHGHYDNHHSTFPA